MDLETLLGYVLALGLPVWLAVEQLLHTFKVPSGVPASVTPLSAAPPLRRVA